MATIGSWWVSSHEARPDEEVLASYHVNHVPTASRPIGGKLYRTNERLLFSPHLLDAWLGGERVGIELTAIEAVEKLEGVTDPDAGDEANEPGATTDRVHLICGDDSTHTFIVDDVEATLEEIREAMGSTAGGA